MLPLTQRANQIQALAKQEAQRLNCEFVGTEHLLLGIIQEGGGVAAKVLKNLNIDQKRVRQETEKLITPSTSPTVTLGQMPFSPRAKHALELADEAACQFGHEIIGTEHLFLGILMEKEGIAAQVLINLGLKLDEVRDLVLEVLGVNAEPWPPCNRTPVRNHFISASCQGQKCRICSLPATHKVGEEIPHDDPMPARHNLTAYVCCAHFMEIVGPVHTGPCRGA